MKTKFFLFITSVLISGAVFAFSSGASKTGKFKVYGNCGMCESRIEKAAKSVKGVTSAQWEKESMVLTVAYDQSKADIHKIHSAVAKAGHDTDKQRAGDEVYEKLHSCCKYKRADIKAEKTGCSNGTGTAACCQ